MTAAESKNAAIGSPAVLRLSGGIRTLFSERAFIAALLMLLVAAVAVRFSKQYLQLHFRKEPVPMRRSFAEAMPPILGDWVRAADETLRPDIQSELAAQDWLFCSYIKASAFHKTPEELRQEFSAQSYEEQRETLGRYGQMRPEAIVALGLTYYTGKVDTVSHIADRCYVASGWDPVSSGETKTWTVGDRSVDVKWIAFENPASRSNIRRNVAYLFHVNGSYTSDSIKVRAALQNLFARYGYYAKVELSSLGGDRDQWIDMMRDFLAAALPKVESALPDWSQYENRK